eukprot:jgi/Pico_ML_1/51330/g2384.t1
MGKSKGKHRLDKYYHLAKEQGYRSRAAFKLVQLHRSYGFLGHARAVLDLCAAPGGWLQVARKHMPMAGLLVGVDLAPIRNVPGATTLVEDITTQKCRAAIKRIAKGGQFDVVLHDGAPNVGGAWASEANMQSVLVLESLKLATAFLAPNGTYVTKVFRSSDYTALLYAFNQLFHKVESTKPQASRNASAEIFVVCQGYKAPNKIDPRLLDHRHLFQDYADKPKAIDVLAPTKQKRHREGYEEGISTTHKPGSVLEFVNSESPVAMLGEYTQLLFQAPSEPREGNPAKKAKANTPALTDSEEEEEDSTDQDEETFGDNPTHDARKGSRGADLTLDDVENAPETNPEIRSLCKDLQVLGIEQDVELFDLGTIARRQDLERLEERREDLDASEDGQDPQTEEEHDTDSEGDSEAEEAYQASVEKALDALYERHLEGTDSKSASRRRRRARIGEMELDADVPEEIEEGLAPGSRPGIRARATQEEEEEEEEEEERNPLLLDLDKDPPKPTPKAVTVQWFSQDVFKDIQPEFEDVGQAVDRETSGPGSLALPGDEEEDSEEDSPSEDETDARPEDQGSDDSSSSDSELEDVDDLDDDARAEILAYGKKMLRRKDKENIIDASYNRYVFHDQDLPAWFAEDEKKHMQPQRPITKEEFMEAKTQLRAIDSRAIHKVAEAKARKRKRLGRRMDKARKKAGGIADQEDMPVAAKAREIKKLYAQAKKGVYGKSNNSKKKKGRGAEYASKKPLDRRQLADQRGRGAKKTGAAKRGGKGALRVFAG